MIESELAEPLTWHTKPDVKSCRLYIQADAEIENRNDWGRQHEGLLTKLHRLNDMFRPRVIELDASQLEGLQAAAE